LIRALVEVKKPPPLDAQQKSAMEYAERQVATQLALLHYRIKRSVVLFVF
jgi:hypothetical protein